MLHRTLMESPAIESLHSHCQNVTAFILVMRLDFIKLCFLCNLFFFPFIVQREQRTQCHLKWYFNYQWLIDPYTRLWSGCNSQCQLQQEKRGPCMVYSSHSHTHTHTHTSTRQCDKIQMWLKWTNEIARAHWTNQRDAVMENAPREFWCFFNS